MAALAMIHSPQGAGESMRFQEIVGNSPALESVLKQVQLVGPTDSTVLILGETGTGKELIASGIHSVSRRCGRPFVKLNCAAIPAELLESELFGHERGAFTGAVAQRLAALRRPTVAPCSWTKLATFPSRCRPSYCVYCRNRSSNAWVVR
jgi:formate hydrogenlyase transcriptional activator